MKNKNNKILELFFAFLLISDTISGFIAAYFAVVYMSEGDELKSLISISLTLISFFILILINIAINKLGL